MTDEKKSEVYIVENHDSKEDIDERMQETYGISLEAFIKMFNDKEGKCDICGIAQDINHTVIDLHQDTLQTDKVIRGTLCLPCKDGLIKFAYNSADLYKASQYVRASLFWSEETGLIAQHYQESIVEDTGNVEENMVNSGMSEQVIRDNHEMMQRFADKTREIE